MKKTNQGFTLVELSIVIIIIGFLIAGISAGQSLIAQAKLTKVINELQQYDMAVNIFIQQYDAIPGDMPNASSYWPSAFNGNGDGQVKGSGLGWMEATEPLYFWQHLSLAGLISGNYTGIQGNAPNYFEPGINVPISAYPKTVYNVVSNSDWNQYSATAPRIYLMNENSSDTGNNNSSVLLWLTMGIQDAANFDTKIDDGNPLTGKISSWGAAPNYCTNYDLNTLGGAVPSNPSYMLSSGNLPYCVVEWALQDYVFVGGGH